MPKVSKEKETPIEDMSKYFTKVDKLPPSTKRHGEGKYRKIVNAIATQRKGNYKIEMGAISKDLKLKSIFPSIEKVLQSLAVLNGCDMTKITKQTVQTKKGAKTYVHHPEYDLWKANNIRLRVSNKELYIEKLIDAPLKTL